MLVVVVLVLAAVAAAVVVAVVVVMAVVVVVAVKVVAVCAYWKCVYTLRRNIVRIYTKTYRVSLLVGTNRRRLAGR